MVAYLYGFNWTMYAERIMPAFAPWLLENNASAVDALFQQTRCAREEQFLPKPMHELRTWFRAQLFIKQIPRGPHTRSEYHILCSAQKFDELSDSYVHRHPPQLYQNSDALRAVWGALVEEYCLSPFALTDVQHLNTSSRTQQPQQGELVSLLHAAGLDDLAREVHTHTYTSTLVEVEEEWPEDIEETQLGLTGVNMGHQTTLLHMRGWLASLSVRAMSLFELLACGRRCMPFGYRSGEPYENYVGYLTSHEVLQLATCLQHTSPPTSTQATADFQQFRLQQQGHQQDFRMIDEVLPTQAETFLLAVRMAAQYGLGLLCRID